MYKIIENDPFFEDIKTQEARDNLDSLVNYLCSSPVPKEKKRDPQRDKIIIEDEILIDGNYEIEHLSFANAFYNPQNLKLINEVLRNRTAYNSVDSLDPYLIYGFSYIYHLDKEKIVELGTMKFYSSVAIMEHELIHTLMALNNNNPQPQHAEILSIFGELLSLITFSQKNDNPIIYENALINKCITRMYCRFFTSEFSDEYIKMQRERNIRSGLRNTYPYISQYPYMLGFIYASRLLNIYRNNPSDVLSKVNDILSGKSNVDDLLSDYNISLTDKNTCEDFISLCDQYRDILKRRYSSSQLHSMK